MIQVLISHQFARDVARRRRLIVALIAARAPGVQLIERRSAGGLITGLIGAGHDCLLSGMNRERLIRAGQLAFACTQGHDSGGGVGLDVDPIFAGRSSVKARFGVSTSKLS